MGADNIISIGIDLNDIRSLKDAAKSIDEIGRKLNLSKPQLKAFQLGIEGAVKNLAKLKTSEPFTKLALNTKKASTAFKKLNDVSEKMHKTFAKSLASDKFIKATQGAKALLVIEQKMNVELEKQARLTARLVIEQRKGSKVNQQAASNLRIMQAETAALEKKVGVSKKLSVTSKELAYSTKKVQMAMAGMARSVGVATLSYSALLPLMAGMAIGSSIKSVYELGAAFEYTTTYIDALSSSADGLRAADIQSSLLGLEGLRKGPQELAAGMKEFAKAGVEAAMSLGQIAEMSKFATIAELDLASATKLVIGQSKAFGIKFTASANMIAAAALSSATDIKELGTALSYTTELATVTGTKFDEVATAMAIMANAGIRGCYDRETDVLTKDGWKKWEDVTYDDEFATYNEKTGEIEYQKPDRLIRYHHTGSMYKVCNKGIDLCVTPEHRMFVKRRGQEDYEILTAEDVAGKTVRYKTGGLGWSGASPKVITLPGFKQHRGSWVKKIKPVDIDAELWATFLGWYIAEGHCNYYKGNYRVVITQKKSKHLKHMVEVFDALPWNYNRCEKTGQYTFCNEQMFRALKPLGNVYKKHIPSYAKSWDTNLLSILYRALLDGDGDDEHKYYTSSISLRDDIQEIALKLGYATLNRKTISRGDTSAFTENQRITARADGWRVSITSKRTEPWYCPSSYKGAHGERLVQDSAYEHFEGWIDYDDEVFCAEVPNGLLIVRRKGRAIVSGNSKAGTAIRTSLLKMATPTTALRKKFDALGISWTAFSDDGKIKSMRAMFTELKRMTDGLPDTQRVAILKGLFGLRALKGGANLLRAQGEEWDKLNAKIKKAATGSSYINEVYNRLADTTTAKWEKLGVAIEKAFIQAFSSNDVKSAIESMTAIISSSAFSKGLTSAVSSLSEIVTLITSLGNVVATASSQLDKAKGWKEFFALITSSDIGKKIDYAEKSAKSYVKGSGEDISAFGKLIKLDIKFLEYLKKLKEDFIKTDSGWDSQRGLAQDYSSRYNKPFSAVTPYGTSAVDFSAMAPKTYRPQNSMFGPLQDATYAPSPSDIAAVKKRTDEFSKAMRVEANQVEYDKVRKTLHDFYQGIVADAESSGTRYKKAMDWLLKKPIATVYDSSKIFQGLVPDDAATSGVVKLAESFQKLVTNALDPYARKVAEINQVYEAQKVSMGLVVIATEEERVALTQLTVARDKDLKAAKSSLQGGKEEIAFLAEITKHFDAIKVKNEALAKSIKDIKFETTIAGFTALEKAMSKIDYGAVKKLADGMDPKVVTAWVLAQKGLIKSTESARIATEELKKSQVSLNKSLKDEERFFKEVTKAVKDYNKALDKHNKTIADMNFSAQSAGMTKIQKLMADMQKEAKDYGTAQAKLGLEGAKAAKEYYNALVRQKIASGELLTVLIATAKEGENVWKGFNAGILEAMQNTKSLGQLGSDLGNQFYKGVSSTFSLAFKGEFNKIGDRWKTTLKGMLDSVIQWASDAAAKFVISGAVDLIFGSGTASSMGLFGGPKGTSSDPLHVVMAGMVAGAGGTSGNVVGNITQLAGQISNLSTIVDQGYRWANQGSAISDMTGSLAAGNYNQYNAQVTQYSSVMDDYYGYGQDAATSLGDGLGNSGVLWGEVGGEIGAALSSAARDAINKDLDKLMADQSLYGFDPSLMEYGKAGLGAAAGAYNVYGGIKQGGAGGYLQAAGGAMSVYQSGANVGLYTASPYAGAAGSAVGVVGGAYGMYQGFKNEDYVGAASSTVQTALAAAQLYGQMTAVAATTAATTVATTAATTAATGAATVAATGAATAAATTAASTAATTATATAVGGFLTTYGGVIGAAIGMATLVGGSLYESAKKENRYYRYGSGSSDVLTTMDVYKKATPEEGLWQDTVLKTQQAVGDLSQLTSEGLAALGGDNSSLNTIMQSGGILTADQLATAMQSIDQGQVSGLSAQLSESYFNQFDNQMKALALNFNDSFANMAIGIQPTIQGFNDFITASSGLNVSMMQSNDLMNQAIVSSTGNGVALRGLSIALEGLGMSSAAASVSAMAMASAARGVSPAMKELAFQTNAVTPGMNALGDAISSTGASVNPTTSSLLSLEAQLLGVSDTSLQAVNGISSFSSSFGGMMNVIKGGYLNMPIDTQSAEHNKSGAVYSYHARGGIMERPTVFHIGGEAGSEAILPLHNGPSTLKKMDEKLDALASKTINVNIIGDERGLRQFVRVEADVHITSKLQRGQGLERVAF